jgi:hypothetical protein
MGCDNVAVLSITIEGPAFDIEVRPKASALTFPAKDAVSNILTSALELRAPAGISTEVNLASGSLLTEDKDDADTFAPEEGIDVTISPSELAAGEDVDNLVIVVGELLLDCPQAVVNN